MAPPRPAGPVEKPLVITPRPTCPGCGERAYQWQCTEFRKDGERLVGWVVNVRKCTNTRRQKGSRDLACGWKDKTLLHPVAVSTDVARVFDVESEEEEVPSVVDEARPRKSSDARVCPDCGGTKSPQAEKCRKCSFVTRALQRATAEPEKYTNGTSHAAPVAYSLKTEEAAVVAALPAPRSSAASDIEDAFQILMSRPSYAVLPLVLGLEPHERAVVERAILEVSKRPR